MDMFYVEAVSLGRLKYVQVGHDGDGYGSGFYLDKIFIRESDYAPTEYVFMCYQWFDDRFGDCEKVSWSWSITILNLRYKWTYFSFFIEMHGPLCYTAPDVIHICKLC